jgi:AcrR family transcriptional regulator
METSLPKKNNVTTPKEVRAYGHELLRRTVLEAASRLLVQEGPDALTVRRIAHELRCSTKILYTMFHGKDGLANALYLEGCEHLRQALVSVPRVPDIKMYLCDTGWAYWSFALANRSYYMVMFCGAIPNFAPAPSSIQATEQVFEMLVDIVQRAIERGELVADNALFMAKSLWTSLHGVLSLYFINHIPTVEEAKAVFERVLNAIVASMLPAM